MMFDSDSEYSDWESEQQKMERNSQEALVPTNQFLCIPQFPKPYPGYLKFLDTWTTAALQAVDDFKIHQSATYSPNLARPFRYRIKMRDIRALEGGALLPLDTIKYAIGHMAMKQTDTQKEDYLVCLLPELEEDDKNFHLNMRNYLIMLLRKGMTNMFKRKVLILGYFTGDTARLTVIVNPKSLLFRKREKGSGKGQGVREEKAKVAHYYTNLLIPNNDYVLKLMNYFLFLCAAIHEGDGYYYDFTFRDLVEGSHWKRETKEEMKSFEMLLLIEKILATSEDAVPDLDELGVQYVYQDNSDSSPAVIYRDGLSIQMAEYLNRECSDFGLWCLERREILLADRREAGLPPPAYTSPVTDKTSPEHTSREL